MYNYSAERTPIKPSPEWAFQNIIPISYDSGCGGNFLTSYLVTAKYQLKFIDVQVPLSSTKNVHKFTKHINDLALTEQGEAIIQDYMFIWENFPGVLQNHLLLNSTAHPPYFLYGHFLSEDHIDGIGKNFDRSIFVNTDDPRRENLFWKKVIPVTSLAERIEHNLMDRKQKVPFMISGWLHKLNEIVELKKEKALIIHLSELLDPTKIDFVTSKLSALTQIPEQNFDKSYFKHWQDETLLVIQQDQEDL